MRDKDQFDVAVIGGGPAGISAAIWACDLGLSTALIEGRDQLGGQLTRVHNAIRNYPGRFADSGNELRDFFVESLSRFNADVLINSSVERVDLLEKKISLAGGRVINASAIVIATGVRRRKLNVAGEVEFVGKGILESGVKQKEECRGKRVVIVGGGDAALENAVILSEYAESIHLVHRRDAFAARGEFVEKAERDPKVEMHLRAEVAAIEGREKVESVTIKERMTGVSKRLEADAVLVRIGVEANSSLVRGQVATDDEGYIIVDSECRTNLPGIFASGDVANPVSPTVSTAAGMGATAAKAAYDLIYGS
ncbi:MAG: FAD-dependent oxidoreductase [Pyrinomonadaceae bacterium]|nr:FAD-dependent oxidoreductase [Pyrinomonadaceae bacterium]